MTVLLVTLLLLTWVRSLHAACASAGTAAFTRTRYPSCCRRNARSLTNMRLLFTLVQPLHAACASAVTAASTRTHCPDCCIRNARSLQQDCFSVFKDTSLFACRIAAKGIGASIRTHCRSCCCRIPRSLHQDNNSVYSLTLLRWP